ncbi:MAG: Dabb family protein [Acidimicrobiales bacterium]
MIRHIVFFKFAEDAAAVAAEGKAKLESLVGKVPQIRALEAGVNVVEADRAYDLALTVTFDSVDDLDAYGVHPEHQIVGGWLRERSVSIVACDYEA